jgi:enoyl-CoA hydratase
MNYEILKTDVTNGIAVVTISRPQALNALNSKVFAELNALLDDFSKRTDIKVMILTGEGKAFVAGADIAEMSEMNSEQGKKFSELGQGTFRRLEELPFIVIAAVNGFALGGGCELSMACDIRIASTNAKFGQPEVNLGLIPGYAGTVRLPRFVGLSNALYLLATADMINGEEALRMGLVQKVVEPEKLMEETLAIAAKIAAKGPVAVKTVKETTRKGMLTDFHSACELEAQKFGGLFGNGESGEGMKAFLEKRKPNW